MKKPLTAPAIHPTWMKYIAQDLITGRNIDQAFIKRGFSAINAEIDFTNSVYGAGAYDAALEAHSSKEAFEHYRILESEIYRKLDSAEKLPQQERDDTWDDILGDRRIPSFLKQTALRSLNNNKYEALLQLHTPALIEALRVEQNSISILYPDPAISLIERDMVSLRKEVLNSVMSDAYGKLGFEVLNRKRNVNSYVKKITADYNIVIEPDVTAIERPYASSLNKPASVYWPLISYDRFCRLTLGGKTDKSKDMFLHAGTLCIASRRINAYEDTRSLEVMVRADALWYELTVEPFEKLIIDFCEHQGYPPKLV